jgi:hypothetical protein
MLLQHLKRRATQIDLPLILGTTNMYTDWYLPSQQEAVNIITECIINGNVDLVNLLHNFSVGGFMPVTYTDFSGIHGNAIRVIHHGGNGSAYATYVGNNAPQWRVIRKIPHTDFNLGDFEVGGIVVYIDNTNNYSLIIKQDWGPTAGLTNLFAPDLVNLTIDDGLANTIEIANQSTTSAAIDTLDFISRIYLPVLQNSTDYKLDIDWGDGIKRRYEGAGSDLFDDSFTYTEAAFPDVGVFNADVPTDYTTWIDFFDPAGGARFPTVNGNTLTETLSNLYQAAAKKFIYDKTYKFTTVSLNVKKEVATNDEVFGFRIQKDSTVNNDDIYGDATISKEDGTIYSQSGWEELTVVDNGSSLTINGTVMANTNTSSLVILPAIGFTYSPLTFVATGSITINSIELKAYTQPDIKVWARNGADNNLNFNRTSWLTHGDTLIQEGDMSKEPLDISIDANQNGIPDDWE